MGKQIAMDLAFFKNEEGKITHVGILTARNKIIHASGEVRIDGLTQEVAHMIHLHKTDPQLQSS